MTTRRDLMRLLLASSDLDQPLCADELLDLILPPEPPPDLRVTASTGYLTPPTAVPAPVRSHMSMEDVAAAWRLYSDTERHVSLYALAAEMGFPRNHLTKTLRRVIGDAFTVMTQRRSPGGDLYKYGVRAGNS